jgi:hypothetical protein
MRDLRPHGFGLSNIRMVKRKDAEYMHLPDGIIVLYRSFSFLTNGIKKRYN